jgi:hypothetical protein
LIQLSRTGTFINSTQRFSVLLFFGDQSFLIDVAKNIVPHFYVHTASGLEEAFNLMRKISVDAIVTDAMLWDHLSNNERDRFLSLEEQSPIMLLYAYQFQEEQVAGILGALIASTIAQFSGSNAPGQKPKTNYTLRTKDDEERLNMTGNV